MFFRHAALWCTVIHFATLVPVFSNQDLEYEVEEGDSVAIDTCGTFCRYVRVGHFSDGGLNVGTRIQTDTCGTLAGRQLKCTRKEITSLGGHGGSCEIKFTIHTEAIEKRGGTQDTVRTTLISWSTNQTNNFEFPSCPEPEFEARKNDLRVFDSESEGRHLMAHFRWKKGHLELVPEFHTRLISALEKPDPALGSLEFMHSWMNWENMDADPSRSNVLELHAIQDSIAEGKVDYSIEALKELLKDSGNTVISRISRRRLDSLQTWKKKNQPLFLEGVRKIGRLTAEPFYPPLDSPTVFWRDSLLCVVQQDGKSSPQMRTWNPRTGAWGKAEKARFPETGIKELYELYCEVLSRMLDPKRNCWTRRMEDPGSLECPAWECSPILSLADSIPGTTGNPKHLARAGGSSAAGYGRFEFGTGGLLYLASNPYVAWRVLPDSVAPVYGHKSYEITPEREYPVVVSPDQDWVAFALQAPGGTSIHLWVGRIRYREENSKAPQFEE